MSLNKWINGLNCTDDSDYNQCFPYYVCPYDESNASTIRVIDYHDGFGQNNRQEISHLYVEYYHDTFAVTGYRTCDRKRFWLTSKDQKVLELCCKHRYPVVLKEFTDTVGANVPLCLLKSKSKNEQNEFSMFVINKCYVSAKKFFEKTEVFTILNCRPSPPSADEWRLKGAFQFPCFHAISRKVTASGEPMPLTEKNKQLILANGHCVVSVGETVVEPVNHLSANKLDGQCKFSVLRYPMLKPLSPTMAYETSAEKGWGKPKNSLTPLAKGSLAIHDYVCFGRFDDSGNLLPLDVSSYLVAKELGFKISELFCQMTLCKLHVQMHLVGTKTNEYYDTAELSKDIEFDINMIFPFRNSADIRMVLDQESLRWALDRQIIDYVEINKLGKTEDETKPCIGRLFYKTKVLSLTIEEIRETQGSDLVKSDVDWVPKWDDKMSLFDRNHKTVIFDLDLKVVN
jgi:hypothetical protein